MTCSLIILDHYKPEGRGFDTIFFLNLPTPFSRSRPWDFTQPLTEMTTRSRELMFLGSKARLVRKVSKLTAICELVV
jgi:hypothetical protein